MSSRKKIINRLSRLEGQIKGIKGMVEEERECLDIITQIKAVQGALTMLAKELVKEDLLCEKRKNIDEKYLKTIFKL